MDDEQTEKLAALEQRVSELEAFSALQQRGLECGRVLLDMHQRIFEGLAGQPLAGGASTN